MKLRTYFSLLPVLLALLAGSSLSSCGENAITKATREHQEQFAVADDDSIQAYLKRHSYTQYTRTDDGVYIVPITKGTGTTPIVNGSQVTMRYVGRVVSVNPAYYNLGFGPVPGKVFENTYENRTACGCVTFALIPRVGNSGVAPGFVEGMTYLHQGDRALLIIPSQQAYGPNGNPSSSTTYSIYPDSSLLFDIEVIAIGP